MRQWIDLQSVYRASPGNSLLLRPDTVFTIVAASADYLALSGSDESIIGRALFDVFPDNPALEDSDATRNLRASLERVIALRVADSMPIQRYDVRSADGVFVERYWLPTNAPVLDESGAVEFIVHQVTDAAAEANNDAVSILESITEGFFTLDRRWQFGYVNREAHRILQREPGSLTGRVLWDIYPGVRGTAFEQHYRRSMYGRETTSFAAFYPAHGRWYDVTAFPAAEGLSVYFRDITQQKELQAQRDTLSAESEQQRRIYETALNNIEDFVYVFDLEHRVMYANASLLKTWGTEDARGKRLIEIGYELPLALRHESEFEQVARTRVPFQGESHFTGTTGRRLYDYILVPVLDAQGAAVAVAGTTRDITERHQMTQRMLQSQRLEAMGTLASGVAHDFNNILAAILGNVGLAQQQLASDSEALDRLRLVNRAAQRARSLVRQILAFSRLAPRQDAVQPLLPLVDEAMALLRSTSPPAVALELRCPPQALSARVDAAQFQQVIVNLCTNAWQALGETGGVVHVALTRVELTAQEAAALGAGCGSHVKLTVSDQGPGMDESVRHRIFEPFFTTKPLGQGTGLGLAIVQGFVTDSGGAIQVDSAVGCGTTVSVYLPWVDSLQNLVHGPPAADSPLKPGAVGHGAQLMYIDDDEVVSMTAAALLERAGYRVTCAVDGQSALRMLRTLQGGCDVVITDFNMPSMSGLAIAAALRREAPTTPVIVISGLVTDELQTAAREHGVYDVVPKEDLFERLPDAVKRALEARTAH